MQTKRWQFWVGVLISAGALFYVLYKLNLKDFWMILSSAKYFWVIPGLVLYFIGVWVRAWRWHYLLREIKPIKTNTMFHITCIGYMGNNIYPARAGEILRAYVLKRKEGVPISASLATIIVERVFDGVVMLAFIFINLPELSKLTSQNTSFAGSIQGIAIIGTLIFIGALLVLFLAAMFPQKTINLGDWFVVHICPKRFQSQTLAILKKFLDGLVSLRSPGNILMVFLTSFVIWLLETGKYWFVMQAFNFKVSFFALMLMNGIVNLVTTIPSTPGYVGTFDGAGVVVLMAYGVNQALATGYTIVLHVALWLPITLLGAFFMLREGISWKEKLRTNVLDEEQDKSDKQV
jgi:uncharacterized protein (TIRG00374 family)